MSNFWKKLKIPFTILAPMDDVTDNVFRQVILSAGRPDVFFTEFTNADGIIYCDSNGVVQRRLKYTKDQHPIVAQIWGTNPKSMEKASKIVAGMGFDGIDINMSCPVRAVVKKGAGAGLIGKYDEASKIISAVKKGANDLPVSVKTRLGLNKNIIGEWAEFLLKQGISTLTIHARTATQMSTGYADWDQIGQIVKLRNEIAPNTLIIGNGDIKNYSEVLAMYEKYNVDGVMVGRGIFGNPWIFNPTSSKLRGLNHTHEDYIKLLVRHLTLFEEDKDESKNFFILKKFFKMYINDFYGASELRQKLMDAKNVAQVLELIQKD